MRAPISTAVLAIALVQPTNAQSTSCSVTMDQYKQLQTGMSYRAVKKILGCDGVELSSSDIAGYKTEMYMWSGAGGLGANMNAMFQNDRLQMKAQFGLR
jgi:hypothetical protein